MATIDKMTVIVAYDIDDNEARAQVRNYLLETLAAEQRTESVYEFIFDPSAMPSFRNIIRRLHRMLSPDVGDQMYVWDLEDNKFRRFAVHLLQVD